jgi:hypothetical protein
MLDAYGPQELGVAITEALAAGTIHLAAIHHILDRNRHNRGAPTPMALQLPEDRRVRDLVVTPHALADYDQLSEASTTTPTEKKP